MEYRVWYSKNLGTVTTRLVKNPEEARELINEWIDRDLEDSTVTDNSFGLEVLEDGVWCEYYNEDGDDILEEIDGD